MNETNKKIWVSDLIGDDYKKWRNENIILDCATGSGKTTFCVEVLGKYAAQCGKKILYLCNRTELHDEVLARIKAAGLNNVFEVMTYQYLQRLLMGYGQLQKYDYILADECHYFFTDACFNDFTDVSYRYVTEQKDSVVIYMSATAKVFFNTLEDAGIVQKKNVYRAGKDYSYVDRLYWYKRDDLAGIIDDIIAKEDNSKIVVFCASGKRMLDMRGLYGDKADYYCSKYNKNKELIKLYGWDRSTPKRIIENGTFQKRILFTTSALDNGIDLKDRNIKHIFCELTDGDIMLQALGRKRSLDENDTCTFYLLQYGKNVLQGIINGKKSQVKKIELFRNDREEFIRQYIQNTNSLDHRIFKFQFDKNGEPIIELNDCRYRKYKEDIAEFEKMTGSYREYVEKYVLPELAGRAAEINLYRDKLNVFREYLEGLVGKRLFTEDKEKLKGMFETIGVKIRYKKSIYTFNGALDDNYGASFPYRFYSVKPDGKAYRDTRRKLEDGSENQNCGKLYWMLEPERE